MIHGATHPIPVEALLADDYELTLVRAPLIDTDECCDSRREDEPCCSEESLTPTTQED